MQSVQSQLDHLRRLEPTQEFLDDIGAHGCDIIPVGAFRAILDRRSARVWSNMAVPVDPLPSESEVMDDLDRLRRLFTERERILTFEFNEPLWPDLASILERAGFVETDREPLMLCTPTGFRPVANREVMVRFLGVGAPDTDLIAFQSIFSEVLVGDVWNPTPEAMARMREEVRRVVGRSHALATFHGSPAGTGFISSTAGVAEIARVATLPEARRQGVAATLTSFMLQDRFGQGDTLAWLTAEDPPAKALYEKLGFQHVGIRRYYGSPEEGK